MIKVLQSFEKVRLTCSIDGVEEVIEYQRFPVQWKTVDRTFKRFYDAGIKLTVAPVVSLLNVGGVHRLLDWTDQFEDIYVDYDEVQYPTFLDYKLSSLRARREMIDSIRARSFDTPGRFDPNWKTFAATNAEIERSITGGEITTFRRTVEEVWDQGPGVKFLEQYPWAASLIS